MRLRLSPAQVAALECRPLDAPFEDEGDALVSRAWDREAGLLVFEERERLGLWSALNEASNAEGAAAENTSDRTLRRLAGAASRSLCALASRVLRSAPRGCRYPSCTRPARRGWTHCSRHYSAGRHSAGRKS